MINYPKTSNFKLSLLAILSVFFLSGQLHAQEPEINTEAKKELSFDEKVDQKLGGTTVVAAVAYTREACPSPVTCLA